MWQRPRLEAKRGDGVAVGHAEEHAARRRRPVLPAAAVSAAVAARAATVALAPPPAAKLAAASRIELPARRRPRHLGLRALSCGFDRTVGWEATGRPRASLPFDDLPSLVTARMRQTVMWRKDCASHLGAVGPEPLAPGYPLRYSSDTRESLVVSHIRLHAPDHHKPHLHRSLLTGPNSPGM